MDKQKKNVLLIINPCAGRTKSRPDTSDIISRFPDGDYELSIHATACQGDATNIVRNHYEGKDFVMCCGGDGTLNETINGVMEMPNRIPIGYIPAGSTNDLATTLGLPNDVKKATELIISGHTNSYDIGLFNNRYFSYIAAFGAFTKWSYATSQKMKNRLGHAAYLISGIWDLPSIKSCHMKIEHDGGVIEDDFMFGAVSNTTSVSGLFKFNPDDVKLNDSYFEVLLVRKLKPITAPIAFSKIVRKQYDGKQIVFFKTRNLKVTSDEMVAWTLDGENGGAHNTVQVHVLNKAVNIFSPKNPLFEKEEKVQQTEIGDEDNSSTDA